MCTVGRKSITIPNPASPCARSLLYIGGSLSAAISCFMVMRFATWLLPGARSMAFQVWRHNTCLSYLIRIAVLPSYHRRLELEEGNNLSQSDAVSFDDLQAELYGGLLVGFLPVSSFAFVQYLHDEHAYPTTCQIAKLGCCMNGVAWLRISMQDHVTKATRCSEAHPTGGMAYPETLSNIPHRRSSSATCSLTRKSSLSRLLPATWTT